MTINDTHFAVDLLDVLIDLQAELHRNHIQLLNKVVDGPDNVMVTCIYHKNGQERKPSAGIKKSDGVYHCLACGEVHSLPEFISNCFGANDGGMLGWKWLVRHFLMFNVEYRKQIELNMSRDVKTKDEPTYVSEEELDKYRVIHPYMAFRKLSLETIERFDIGYDKDTKCITFPIRNTLGRTMFIARRSVNSKYFNYPAGAEKPVYGVYELNQISPFPNSVAICESMLDALAVWSWGGYAVALNGLGTEKQFEELRSLPCREFILATDNDDAGRKARIKLRKALSNKLVSEYILPDGVKDMNDLGKKRYDILEKRY